MPQIYHSIWIYDLNPDTPANVYRGLDLRTAIHRCLCAELDFYPEDAEAGDVTGQALKAWNNPTLETLYTALESCIPKVFILHIDPKV